MRQSQLFFRSLKETPKEAVNISHRLLVRASFIDQLSAGIWSLLPLGHRVFSKIENIIREEMNKISGQEIFLPTLQPKELWQKSGRWEKMEPPLFKLKDQHEKEYALGSTHEEVITDLVARHVTSYKQLPFYLYQIQNKFRNETRVSGGLLRVKEFVMKDLYSFHASKQDLDRYYLKVLEAYQKIFSRCRIEVVVVEASSGSIGGDYCHEFMALAPSGEDKVFICEKCSLAKNIEMVKGKQCLKCGHVLQMKNGIEAAHIFKLGDTYSKKMGAYFTDKDSVKKPIQMGCYGIGVGRLMATIVEASHDKNGIIWPPSVAPFQVHLLSLGLNNKRIPESIYKNLVQKGYEVLYDEREATPAIKLKDSDLIGLPVRLVLSDKTKDKIEVKMRNEAKIRLMNQNQLLKYLKQKYD